MVGDRQMPEGVAAYSKTQEFTQMSVPKAITGAHNTKPGVWGALNVTAGEVRYFLEGAAKPLAVVGAGETFVIKPEEWHFVQLTDDAKFFVEFYR
ncbi:MAG: DUF1971 domain-containing protein [Pseudomonadota bacterium]